MGNLGAKISMPRLVIGMRSKLLRTCQRGFTLLEIMIVILIVSITLTFALLSFGDFGNKRRIIVAAEQFMQYFKLIQQQAILEAGTLGVKLSPQGYQVFRYDNKGYWTVMNEKKIFSFQTIPNAASLDWTTARHVKNEPEIIFHPSGDMSAFTVFFNSRDKTKLITIQGAHDGRLTMIQANE